MTKRILSIILVWMGCLTLWAQSSGGGYGGDFNPTNPDDPAVPDKPQVVVTYRLTLQATVGGTVSHNQSGSDFQAGTRLRLTATPQANYKFVHWVQGETVVSTQTSFYYTMPAEAVTLQAVFEFYPGAYGGDMNPSDPSQPGISVKSYKLTASAVGNGSVSCSSSSVQMGTSAYVSATANTGYRFTGWMCEGELVSTEPYYPFVMDNRDAHYTAHFEFAPSSPNQPSSGGAVAAYTLTYRIGGRNYYSEQLTVGTRITPIDNPVRKGHTFNGWSVIPDSMPSRNVTIDGSFTAARHELQFVVNGEVIKKDSVAYGTVIVAPDVDATGEKAFQWHNMPGIMPDHDVVVSGVYSSIKYNVIYRVDGEEYKRVEYDEGAPIYYEIPPIKEGYTFDGWVGVPTVMPQNYVVATGSLKPSTTFNLVYIIDGMKYHTERIAAGAPVTLLVPEKEGYLFTGWNETPTIMPNHDVYLEGSFVFAIFNITYLVDGEVYKTVRTPVDNVIAPVAAPTKEGYTFTGWTGLPDKMPAKDITVSASYVVNRYKVTYMLDGAVHHTDSVAYGTPLTALAAPTKEGHTFSGWVGLPETMPAKDVTVTGSLAVNSYKVTYVVDDVVYRDTMYQYGAAVDAVAEPTKDGHTFSGWIGIPATMPAKDVTVTGSFTVNTYKLTYTFAGEVYHTDSIAYGAVVNAVEVPVKEGYTFSGWVGLPETMPAKDVTVDGTYTINSYKVTYVVDGVVYRDTTYQYGAAVDAVAEPTKEGYTFSGWSGIPVSMPAKDVTVIGSFMVNTYKITYTFAGEVYHTDSIAYGAVVKAIEVPAKEGYTFSGWVGLPETMPAKDVTVDGTYTINSYKVTYVVDDVVYKDSTYTYGAAVDAVAEPTKEGYTFSGWSGIPVTMPAKDVTVTGSFTVNTYKLTYTFAGEVYHTDSIAYGAVVKAVEVPVKEGYTFSGWVGLPETMPAKDVTVDGTYTINSYKVTYVVDGVVYRDTTYQYGDHVASSEAGKVVPTKEGHTFNGWSEIPERMPAKDVIITGSFTVNSYKVTYTVDGRIYHTDSIAYGTALNPIADPTKEGTTFSGWSGLPATMPAYDVFVKATFDAKTYRVTYIVDGEVYHTDSVKYATEFEALAEPTKEGYTFSGWSEIPYAMPAGDVTITGNFTINTYRVTYVVDGVEYVVDSVNYAGGITPMPEPTKEGHTFSGWSEIPDTMGTKDVIVVGTFTVNTYKITFTVDGEVYHTDSVAYAQTVIPATVPTKEGYTFSGWREMPRTMPAGDVIVAGFFTINTYVITYLVDGEEYFKEAIVYADVVTPIAEPEKEGYTFSGWSEIPDSMPAKNVTVRGSFILNAKQTDDQGLIYELNEARDAFEVGGYTDELGTDVVIASELYGLPVNTIQAVSLAFADMKSIVIPASITTVGRKAFGDCESLLTVEWNTTAPLSAECFSRVSNYGNMLVYVADARTEVTFQGNVVVNGVAEQITLTDGLPFDNTRDFTARSITFTRDFTKQTMIGVACGWEALVLPFDVQRVMSEKRGELKPFGEADFMNALPYWIGELQVDGTFTTASGIVANKPFIMQVPNSNEYEDQYNVEGMITFSATDVTVHATADMEHEKSEGYTLLGSYQGTVSDSHVCALNDEEYVAADDIYRPGSIFVADSRDVRPFEAYVYNNKVFSSPCLRIDSQATTDIEQLMQHVADDGWYTLQGVRLDTKPVEKGIYIHNRRVVVVR